MIQAQLILRALLKRSFLKPYRFALLISAVLSVSGCAMLQSSATTSTSQTSSEPSDTAPAQEEITYSDFSLEEDTLYDLLVAEVASQREQFEITLVNYIHQAQVTRDPAIIFRAINAAQLSQDSEAIKELGDLWLDVSPDSIPAHQVLAYQYALDKNFTLAIYHIGEILELGGHTSVEGLAINSSNVSDEQKEELLVLYSGLMERFPEHWDIRYSMALVQRNLKQCDKAIENLEQVIAEQPDFPQAAIVKINCLDETGKKKEALAYAEDSFERFPNSNAIGRLYASLLIEHGQTEEAEQVFLELRDYYPDSPTLALSHALLMLENGKTAEPKRIFERLKGVKAHQNDAYYYLGRIAEQEKDSDLAIEQYQNVKPGQHYNSAVERRSYLLAKNERLDEALESLAQLREQQPENAVKLWLIEYQLLNTFNEKDKALTSLTNALEQSPNDEQLRYARAMHYDSLGKMAEMEQDLRIIIEKNPKNAIALNALGYTLADKTDRYEEALKLITAALTLKPNNPAIMDSMGWILFKLGDNEKALQLLGRAYLNYPDGEVAAHLGEVLWTMGKQEEAKKVWTNNLKQQPDHPILRKTLERLAPELLTPLTPSEDSSTTEPESSTEQDDNAPAPTASESNPEPQPEA